MPRQADTQYFTPHLTLSEVNCIVDALDEQILHGGAVVRKHPIFFKCLIRFIRAQEDKAIRRKDYVAAGEYGEKADILENQLPAETPADYRKLVKASKIDFSSDEPEVGVITPRYEPDQDATNDYGYEPDPEEQERIARLNESRDEMVKIEVTGYEQNAPQTVRPPKPEVEKTLTEQVAELNALQELQAVTDGTNGGSS